MKINCLSCGYKIDVGEAYDNFEGEVRCYVCGGLMEIKTIEGEVKSVKRSRDRQMAAAAGHDRP